MKTARGARRRDAVLLIGSAPEWPAELLASIAREGYVTHSIEDLSSAISLLGNGGVKAVLVPARPLGAKDLLGLRRCRTVSPPTAIVVTTTTPNQPDLKRAFESGATAFLSWPASPEVVRQALGSGTEGATTGEAPVMGRASDRACEVKIDNQLPASHPQREALESRIREALAQLSGPWDVGIGVAGDAMTVTIVAPNGSRWAMTTANPDHQSPEFIVEQARIACGQWRARNVAAAPPLRKRT